MTTPKEIFFILNRPSHPGNIGASARALKSMNLNHLQLVCPDDFPSPKAEARATHGKDVLQKAEVFDTLKEALADKNVVFALSARNRDLNWPHLDARQAAEKIHQYAISGNKVAIIFGREESGLSNDELALSHYLVHIVSNPSSNSLNLAQAVQIMAYEIFAFASLKSGQKTKIMNRFRMDEPLASQDEIGHLLSHFNQLLDASGFLLKKQDIRLKRRISRIIQKAQLDTQEATLLRGIFASIIKYQNNKSKKTN